MLSGIINETYELCVLRTHAPVTDIMDNIVHAGIVQDSVTSSAGVIFRFGQEKVVYGTRDTMRATLDQ